MTDRDACASDAVQGVVDLASEETERLLAEVRTGSSEALGTLMDACRRYLLLVARAQLGDDLQAKFGASDLVQETYLHAQRNFGRFDGTSPAQLRAWLRRILLNRLATVARDYRHTAKRGLRRERSLDVSHDSDRAHRFLPARSPSPSQCAAAQEEHDRLEAALSRLPDSHLQVILLRNRQRYSFAEIGEILQISPDAARKLWVRAVEGLQAELDVRAASSPIRPLPLG